MYVQYGSFQFEPWEAGISSRARFIYSPRGFKKYQHVRFDIDGELCIRTGQPDIRARLGQITAAFSLNDRDIGLYHDDGTPSHHFLSTTTRNLTGNQVIQQSYPTTNQGEYTSGRKFAYTVAALLYDPEESLLEHSDSLRRVSNAGTEYRWKYNRYWGYYPEVVVPSTMQIIYHVGSRVGIDTWPLPITPFYDPPFELNHLRQVKQHSPIRYPNGFAEYRTTWSYVYALPTFDDISRPLST